MSAFSIAQSPIKNHMTKNPKTLHCHESLEKAASMMREHSFRHLPVLQGQRLVGLLSLHDITRVEAIQQVDASRITVAEAMTPEPFVCGPNEELRDVATRMVHHHIGSAIVQENGEILGIFTAQDALRCLITA